MTPPEPLQRFLNAQRSFGALVESVGDTQWTVPTPCDAWDVRALVNHLVNEQLWATPMLDGRTVADVGDQLDGDLLGAEPVAAWHAAATESAAAFSAPGALDVTINSSMGPSPAKQYLAEMTCDLIAHRWDLGRGLGVEQRFTTDELDQLQALADALAPMQEQLVAAGVFGARLPVAPDADRQTQLLAALGRVG